MDVDGVDVHTSIPLYTNDGPAGRYSAGYARPLPSKSAKVSFTPVEAALALKNGARSTGTPVPCVFAAIVALLSARNVRTNAVIHLCVGEDRD